MRKTGKKEKLDENQREKVAISGNFGETVPFINYTLSRETISSEELTQLRKRQISRHIIFLQ